MGFVIAELLQAGLLDGSAATVWGSNLAEYAVEPVLRAADLDWQAAPKQSLDEAILRPASNPHSRTGGLVMLDGNMGRSVIKISAVAEPHQKLAAPAAVFHSEAEVRAAFEAGQLDRDVIVVVIGQGPKANGMPELHALTPLLGSLQDKGFQVGWSQMAVCQGVRKGACGHSCQPGGPCRRPDWPFARWRYDPAGCSSRAAGNRG